MRPLALSARQEEVAAKLYTDYGWSALQIAAAAGCGRRAIENALARQGVDLRKGSRPHLGPDLPLETGRAWLAEAGRGDRSEARTRPAKRKLKSGTIVYRKRRCQECGTLSEYEEQCPKCGEPMDYLHDPETEAIQSIIKKEQTR